MAEGPLDLLVSFWKEWGILVLVLLSFWLQVILLITAEIRRRKDSGALKVVVWSAYLLADTTAIYALGHMSVTSTMSQEHQLMAFWAPFLLLHLDGQDNITAYSIEDNRLWLCHLQSFVLQVLAASYVLYQSSIVARGTLLRPAAILVFVVGVVKYGERVCALKLACVNSILSMKNYSYEGSPRKNRWSSNPRDHPRLPSSMGPDPKIFRAHQLLDFTKNLLKGPLPVLPIYMDKMPDWEEMYGVAEMQLSLMHDVFYSKAEMIHTWHGYCIRVVSLPATFAALLLFHRFSEKGDYRKEDVAATYVLLAGAVILEIISLFRAMFSTWTYGKLIRVSCYRVGRALARLALIPLWFRYHVVTMYEMCKGKGGTRTTRYWSGSLGQHNFLYMCSHCKDSRCSKIARWMGREDWWNMLVYTYSVPVSPDISQLLKKHMKEIKDVDHESSDHILNSRGRAALERIPGLYFEVFGSLYSRHGETILVWHIATHVYLTWYKVNHAHRPHHLARVTQELSNYMMFLFATRPYMLTLDDSRPKYVQLCNKVIHDWNDYSTEEDLLRLIRNRGDAINSRLTMNTIIWDGDTIDKACQVGAKLISKDLETPEANMLEMISQVWVELLCSAAHSCTPDSHARHLSNGGEFITVVALMLEYARSGNLWFG